jgi:hypothetical protein
MDTSQPIAGSWLMMLLLAAWWQQLSSILLKERVAASPTFEPIITWSLTAFKVNTDDMNVRMSPAAARVSLSSLT